MTMVQPLEGIPLIIINQMPALLKGVDQVWCRCYTGTHDLQPSIDESQIMMGYITLGGSSPNQANKSDNYARN